MARPTLVRTLKQAAAFVERAGIALVYSNADLVLPSLWEAVAGPRPVDWAVRDETGAFVAFTQEMDRVWRWKDELPERGLVCAGRHVGRSGHATLIAPSVLGSLYALTGRRGHPEDFRDEEGLAPLEWEVAEAVLEAGPATGPAIRKLLGTSDRKAVDRAIGVLQRRLVLTNAGVAEQQQGWPAIRVDILPRRWKASLRGLPAPEDSRRQLAQAVLGSAGELTAADLAAIFSWQRGDAAAVLHELADAGLATARDEDDIRVWSPTPPSAAGRGRNAARSRRGPIARGSPSSR